MHVVGTTALGVGRSPGAAVLSLAGDLAGHVLVRSWALVRGGVAGLRRRVPVWVPSPGAALVGGSGPMAAEGPRLVAPGSFTPPARVSACQEIVLPADPTAPGRARALLQAAVQEWGVDDEVHQDAAMVVTELVANAVDHAHTPSTLTLGLDDHGLSVAVRDGHRGSVPRPRPVDPAAPRGRGLQMVAALAGSWGVTTHLDGKTVWAVLPCR